MSEAEVAAPIRATAFRRRGRSRRNPLGAVLFRTLPWESGLHSMWAGSKLLCLAVLILVTLLVPGWPAAIVLVAMTLVAGAVARVPFSALPRVHWLVTLTLLAGAAASFLGNGLAYYLQALLITFGVFALSLIVGWTTPLPQLAPALVVLGAPLKRLGMPVNEWAVTTALCVRTVPLLFDELRILIAARRLRPLQPQPRGTVRALAVRGRSKLREMFDLLSAVLAVAVRRASEVGTAVSIRGGVPQFRAQRPRLGRADVVAFAVTLLASAVVVVATIAAPWLGAGA